MGMSTWKPKVDESGEPYESTRLSCQTPKLLINLHHLWPFLLLTHLYIDRDMTSPPVHAICPTSPQYNG